MADLPGRGDSQSFLGLRTLGAGLSAPGSRGRRGWRDGRAVTEQPVPGFGDVLRRLRAGARLTQEELAEAAGLSPRTVSDLERGVKRTARKDTAELLADALDLVGPVREVFVAAARGRVPAAEVLAARAEALDAFAGNLPIQLSSFVGRRDDLAELAAAMRRSSRNF